MWSFLWSVFSCIYTEYGDLRSKLSIFLLSIFSQDLIISINPISTSEGEAGGQGEFQKV